MLIKVIIEVQNGAVLGVYAGTEANQLVDVLIIDHDEKSVSEMPVEPLNLIDFSDVDLDDYEIDVSEKEEWGIPNAE